MEQLANTNLACSQYIIGAMATIPETLAIAVQHHQGGRLQAAEQIYRQILAVEPNQTDALHLLGVVAFQAGKPEAAVEIIQRAIRMRGNVAFYHNNLGEAYRGLRRTAEAIACYRRALELKPDYVEACSNLGVALTDQGNLEEAIAWCRRALDLKPDYAMAHNNLGNAFSQQGKPDEAVASYRRAIELDPDCAEAHSNLGLAFNELKQPDEAVVCCRRALAIKPDYVEAHNNLGNALKEQGKLDEAVACYRKALELKPDYAVSHCNLGLVLHEQGKLQEAAACCRRATDLKPDFTDAHFSLGNLFKDLEKLDEAAACYRRALELKPDYADVYSNLGNVLKDQGKLDEAVACYRRALELKPDHVGMLSNLGNALKDEGKLEEAAACCRRAIELDPGFAEAHGNLGGVLEELGDLKGAEDCFRTALRHNPQFAFAHSQLAQLLRGKLPQQELAAQRQMLEIPGLTDQQRLLLHFGLAQTLDARGEFSEAAGHLARANALQLTQWRNRGLEYDPKEHELRISEMIAVCTPDFFQHVRGFGLESEVPIFVVGLPRSGTTLIEQILAGHSRVFGAGEMKLASRTMLALGAQGIEPTEGLRHLDRETARHLAAQYLESLRSLDFQALRIVDKMPDNYLLLGLLASLFPRTKLIHCRRDLRDVAVSCWLTHFREIRWTNDQGHIASRFREYERIMEHWRKVLPAPVLEVDYEETVADLEGVARRLVGWCGLPWEPGCLEFHELKRPAQNGQRHPGPPAHLQDIGRTMEELRAGTRFVVCSVRRRALILNVTGNLNVKVNRTLQGIRRSGEDACGLAADAGNGGQADNNDER